MRALRTTISFFLLMFAVLNETSAQENRLTSGKWRLIANTQRYAAEIASSRSMSEQTLNAARSDSENVFFADPRQARLRIHVGSNTLEQILADGRILNQHVARVSGGGFNPRVRWGIEQRLSGIGFDDDLKRNSQFLNFLPKYATVEFADFSRHRTQHSWEVRADEAVHQYGSVMIFLRSQVLERSTFTVIDSGNARGRLQVQSFHQSKIALARQEIERSEYFEAQVWGDLEIRDIDFIGLTENDISQELGEAFLKNKIRAYLIMDTPGQDRIGDPTRFSERPIDWLQPIGQYFPRSLLQNTVALKNWLSQLDLKQFVRQISNFIEEGKIERSDLSELISENVLQQLRTQLRNGWRSDPNLIGSMFEFAEYIPNILESFSDALKDGHLNDAPNSVFIKIFSSVNQQPIKAEVLERLKQAVINRGTLQQRINPHTLHALLFLAEQLPEMREFLFDTLFKESRRRTDITEEILDVKSEFVRRTLLAVNLTTSFEQRAIRMLTQDSDVNMTKWLLVIAYNHQHNRTLMSEIEKMIQKSGETSYRFYIFSRIFDALRLWPDVPETLIEEMKSALRKIGRPYDPQERLKVTQIRRELNQWIQRAQQGRSCQSVL